jgi:hypothetical protein
MKTNINLIIGLCITTAWYAHASESTPIPAKDALAPLPGLTYAPEGDAIVIRGGTRWSNRPLYCDQRHTVILAGEQPCLTGPMGSLYVGIQRDGKRILLQDFSVRIARYRPGRMEWEMTDPRFPGMTVRLIGTTLAKASGFTAQLKVDGVQPGDTAAWCYFPQPPDKPAVVKTGTDGFEAEHVLARFSAPVGQWEAISYNDRTNLAMATPNAQGPGVVAWIPLVADQAQCLAVAGDENDMYFKRPLDPATVADAAKAFAEGLARAKSVGQQVVVETPDPYFDAGVAASCSAVRGLYEETSFVHGGSAWRFQQPGWRMMGGAFSYGWHEEVRKAVAFWGQQQVKCDDSKTKPVPSEDGCQQMWNSRFYGPGFIHYGPIAHQPEYYEFQTQFFDEAIREWRATADKDYEKLLLPMLELQLDRCKACFDPDDDGLYESYNNTWPSDSVWFNGGATPEQSAYVYYARRAAADMRRRGGDAASAAKHDAEADKIREAMNRVLWLKDKGQFASFVEQGEKRRVHSDAWVYAQHVPIESGMTTPEQTWKAMYYTEWAMERIRFPFGGEMRQTSNWVPGQWSVRELFGGDNYAMALGYFLGGQGDDGWNILRGTMLESMYGSTTPKAGYTGSNGINILAPGGLSQPMCGIDFNDIVTMFARSVVEGLFGYRPDYPNSLVRIEPAFPASWDHASIRTPDFALTYRQNRYTLELTKPAAVKFRLPVRAAAVKQVLLNGKPVPYRIEPWAGYGAMYVEVPSCQKAELVLELEEPAVELPVLSEEKPDGVPGDHLLLKSVKGKVPRYQLTKLHVPESVETRALHQVPADAKWTTIDMSAQWNADVRSIFKQQYLSPRPNTVSMRIGYDGWRAWTFKPWGISVPNVQLAQTGNPVTTPVGALFAPLGSEKNIAFTSLWDNWPKTVTVPVNRAGDAIWLLVCGSTNPMQGRIANAVLRFSYEDGKEEQLELVPPLNFWSLCRFGKDDYEYKRDGFALSKEPPAQVQLGENCRAMVYGWRLRPGVALKSVTLETLSQEVVIGLMGVSVMNPK